MIGYYNYSVILTYGSLISAVIGISVSVLGGGHPYIGILCLMISGLCDAFDGKVARTRKESTPSEKRFGIQIDSLSDLIAFGVLPCCIGIAMHNKIEYFQECSKMDFGNFMHKVPYGVFVAIFALYILAALIRLAYFNVSEEEMQSQGISKRKFYTGLPVTSASLIFPTFVLLQFFLVKVIDISVGYYLLLILVALAFVSKLKVKKPGLKGILIMVGIGIVEFVVIACVRLVFYYGK